MAGRNLNLIESSTSNVEIEFLMRIAAEIRIT